MLCSRLTHGQLWEQTTQHQTPLPDAISDLYSRKRKLNLDHPGECPACSCNIKKTECKAVSLIILVKSSSSSFLACNCKIAPYVDSILHRRQFWAISAASGSMRWWCLRSCWTVLSHAMQGFSGRLLQSARGKANRILLASALSSMHAMCPNRVSRHE